MNPASRKIRDWRHDPTLFARECLQINLDEWQKDALAVLGGTQYQPRRRLAMKACTGPGKSLVLAVAGWHRLTCFAEKNEHPKGAAISGEGRDNLRDNLWSEFGKLQLRSPFLQEAFVWNQERIFAKGFEKTWFLSARSYAKDADAQAIGRALSGLHCAFPFVLLDESGDMPITVGQKAEQIFTGAPLDALIATAGNPTSLSGLLYYIATVVRGQWVLITITADPDDPKRTPRVDKDHAAEQIKLHGRNNPWVMATILGEFPPGGLNTLLGVADVENAMKRTSRESEFAHSQMRLGVDVARFGDDRTIIFPRKGLWAMKPIEMRNSRSHEIAARVSHEKLFHKSELEFIDDTGGWGAGVIDSLFQAGHQPRAVNFSSSPIDPRYFNKRAEIWFMMAEWVKRGGILPNDPSLVRELTTPTYSFQGGKFRLEEKDQIKKRLQFSPDAADALALTFSVPEMPARASEPILFPQSYSKTLTEYDPMSGV
jgi:hypothetical protein